MAEQEEQRDIDSTDTDDTGTGQVLLFRFLQNIVDRRTFDIVSCTN